MKISKLPLFSLLASAFLSAAPPENIPNDKYEAFTLDHQIPVSHWYMDDTYASDKPIVWTKQSIKKGISSAERRQIKYYHQTDEYLYQILEKHREHIQGKKVGIIGSVTPWYECIVLAFGGHPVTVEYNKIVSEDPRIQTMTVEEYKRNPVTFDTIISISSVEHDGLGRYGDPINPYGDIEAMHNIKGMLADEGLLILAVPVGQDLLVWNAHRVYGPIRLPLLLQGWEIIDSAGFTSHDFEVSLEYYTPETHHQPVFVLRANSN